MNNEEDRRWPYKEISLACDKDNWASKHPMTLEGAVNKGIDDGRVDTGSLLRIAESLDRILLLLQATSGPLLAKAEERRWFLFIQHHKAFEGWLKKQEKKYGPCPDSIKREMRKHIATQLVAPWNLPYVKSDNSVREPNAHLRKKFGHMFRCLGSKYEPTRGAYLKWRKKT